MQYLGRRSKQWLKSIYVVPKTARDSAKVTKMWSTTTQFAHRHTETIFCVCDCLLVDSNLIDSKVDLHSRYLNMYLWTDMKPGSSQRPQASCVTSSSFSFLARKERSPPRPLHKAVAKFNERIRSVGWDHAWVLINLSHYRWTELGTATKQEWSRPRVTNRSCLPGTEDYPGHRPFRANLRWLVTLLWLWSWKTFCFTTFWTKRRLQGMGWGRFCGCGQDLPTAQLLESPQPSREVNAGPGIGIVPSLSLPALLGGWLGFVS